MVDRQPNAPAAFYPRKNPWYSRSEAESTSGHMVLLGVPRKKSPVTPPGIDPGTVRLIAQRLNHYATPGPTCLVRVIITSSLYLTHHPANLFYELDTWKPSSSLVIQGIPYSYWTGALRTMSVRTRRRWLLLIQSTVSCPISVKRVFFLYTCSFPNEIVFLISIIRATFLVNLLFLILIVALITDEQQIVEFFFFMEHCSVNLFLHLIGPMI